MKKRKEKETTVETGERGCAFRGKTNETREVGRREGGVANVRPPFDLI